MKNHNLNKAKSEKNDEFYTQLSDIENELSHYTDHFKDKVVYCNCDDPRVSNFFNYFYNNFHELQLKKLIVSCYINQSRDIFSDDIPERAMYIEYNGNDTEYNGIQYFNGDGDFRSRESIEFLKQSDIVVSNPPFSLFRKYVAQLIEYKKRFLVVGNMNAITYKEIFPHIKNNQLWLGVSQRSMMFVTSDGSERAVLARWFTNLKHTKRNQPLELYRTYHGHERDYPKYDNYGAIEVSKVKDIPCDYHGVMGVPITFLDKYNSDQFEILGSNRGVSQDLGGIYGKSSMLNGKETFKRLFIKNRNID